jgi:Fur family ferric uptake transcriptional regulator
MIVEVIAHSGRHITAEEIFEKVQERTQTINIATVYRTLELLGEEGLVSRASLGSGRVVYATVQHGPHVHLVCRHCGRVMDADVAPFEPLFQHIQAQYEFVCDPPHFAIYGHCVDCQAAESATDS